jgi:hypothetical protein
MYSNFFITCSGADIDILKDCPTERTKFIGIGATIFLTAVLAGISGGYAIYFTFNNFLVSFFFGLLWGFIIFNLDRYIVSSIKKTGNFVNELWTAFPRFLIAIVLAITISKPLEIKLFDGSISKKMGEIEDSYNKACEEDFNKQRKDLDQTKSTLQTDLEAKRNNIYLNDPIYKDIEKQKTEKVNTNVDLNKKVISNSSIIYENSWLDDVVVNKETGEIKKFRRYNQLANAKIKENKKLNGDIVSNNFKIGVLEDSLKSRKSDLANQVKATEQQYGEQIAGVQNQIDDLNYRRPEILAKCKADAALDKDILSRLRALSQLKEFGNSVWYASLLITLLFMLLETAPITVKLLAKRGPYDEILDRVEYEIYLQQQKIISDKNDEINNILLEIKEMNKLKGEVRMKTERAKLDAELKANETLLIDIAKKQGDLAKIAVDKWYDDELNKLKGNPSQQHIITKQQQTPPPPPTAQLAIFEDVKWKAKNLSDEVFYIFKNDHSTNNKLEYEENGTMQIGTWQYLTPNKEIKIDLPNFSGTYVLEDLTSNSVKLTSTANDYIELTKV